MRRIVNFRASLFIAVGLIVGVLSFYELLFGDFWFCLISFSLIIAVGILLFVFKSKSKFGIFAVLIALIAGFALAQLRYYLLYKDEVIDRNVEITGRVTDLCRNGAQSYAVYLEDCTDSNGVKYSGRILTYVFDGKTETGDRLTIRGSLNSVYPVKSNVETYNLRINVRYELDAETVVLRQSGKLKLNEKIRKYIFETCDEYQSNNGDVTYALLCGDRNALSAEKESYFKLAGIIHLLAVSGLHVGFVIAVISFFLKRFKLYPLIECAIILVPLLFYAYICDFTPSVIRAIVMVVCSYLARAVFGRYDMLTSLSWAVAVLLVISPYNLFDVGFQLSVLSVFGIATLYSAINRALTKRKLPKFIKYAVNSLAISFSCSVSTFFTLQTSYGYAPLLGIILNLLAIPLVSVAFVAGWIGLLPWIFHYVLYVADWILQAIVISAKWISSTSVSVVFVPAIATSVVVVVLWLFVAGGYVNLRKIGKIVSHSVLAGLLVLCIGLSYVKASPRAQAFVVYDALDSPTCVITSNDGNAVIIGNFSNAHACSAAVSFVNKYKINNCALYFTSYGDAQSVIVSETVQALPVSAAYKLDFSYNGSVDEILKEQNVPVFQQQPNALTGEAITVFSLYDGQTKAAAVRVDGITFAVAIDEYLGADFLLGSNVTADVYVLPRATEEFSKRNLITLSAKQSNFLYNYGANKYGTFTITQKGDTINIKFR